MKRITTPFLSLVMLVAVFTVYATNPQQSLQILNAQQVAKLDLNGKWIGTRNQYSWDKQTFIESFQYEFDLKQEGDIVTGTSTIISSNGEYADMKLEGFLVGNKLHFAETEVKSAIRPDGKVWCFKSGELYFTKDGDNLKLTGATPSYMEVYNYPCSGGETTLTKADNSNNLSVLVNATTTGSGATEKFDISVYPNPFVQTATVSYVLAEDSKVKAEVFDISGKLVNNLFEGNQKKGNYTLNYDASRAGSLAGIFIVKLSVNGEVYSRQLVQMR